MNPKFDVREIEALRERDPDAAAREYDAAWVDADSTYYTQNEIDGCTRKGALELGPEPGWSYEVVSDPATRSNAWGLVVIGCQRQTDGTLRFKVALAREWRGSQLRPLSSSMVIAEIGVIARRYGTRRVWADQHAADPLADLAATIGLEWRRIFISGGIGAEKTPGNMRRSRSQLFEELKAVFATRAIELPPQEQLRRDLLGVKRRVTPVGLSYELAKTPDGRHGDLAAALLLAVTIWPGREERLVTEARRARIASLEAQFAALNSEGGRVDEHAEARRIFRSTDPTARAALVTNAIAVEEHKHAAELALAVSERNGNVSGR